MTPHVTTSVVDHVGTIWLDRPEKRNAMTYEMWAAVGDAADQLGSDGEVRVVVVRSRGDHFCAGADVGGLGSGDDYAGTNKRAEEALAAVPKPTIAFLRGSCVGGGAQLAFACDLRFADTTLRAGITPARLGIVYPPHSVERVVRAIGPSAAKHLLFSAELIDAERALRIGFVDEVHDAETAESRLDAFTALLSTKRSALSQQAAKAMIDAATSGEIAPSLVSEWDAHAAASDDAVEGITAYIEKRDPRFTWNGQATEGSTSGS